MPKIFDCFMFFNELDILSIRLEELYDVVHRFVIIEAPVTHQGNPKPLYFHENRERFQRYADKICHIVVEDMPTGDNHWKRENYQREQLRRALTDAADNDLIVVSDADEIVKPDVLRRAAQSGRFLFLEMGLHYYSLNLRAGMWKKVYCAPKSIIDKTQDLSLPRLREYKYLNDIGGSPDTDIVRNTGWHFTWQLGVDAIIAKLDAFSHAEFRRFRRPDRIRRSIAKRRFFIGGEKLNEVPLNELPLTVQRNAAYHREQDHFAAPLQPPQKRWFDFGRLRS